MSRDWPALLRDPPPDLWLSHEVGDAMAPDSPGGRYELRVRADGEVRVVQAVLGQEQRWRARCEPATVRALLDGFAAIGFPEVPWHEVPPGPSVRVLGAWRGAEPSADPEGAEAICARVPLERDPVFARVFTLCDALVAALVPGLPPPEGVVLPVLRPS